MAVMSEIQNSAAAGHKLAVQEPKLTVEQVYERGINYGRKHQEAPHQIVFGAFLGGYFGSLERASGR